MPLKIKIFMKYFSINEIVSNFEKRYDRLLVLLCQQYKLYQINICVLWITLLVFEILSVIDMLSLGLWQKHIFLSECVDFLDFWYKWCQMLSFFKFFHKKNILSPVTYVKSIMFSQICALTKYYLRFVNHSLRWIYVYMIL